MLYPHADSAPLTLRHNLPQHAPAHPQLDNLVWPEPVPWQALAFVAAVCTQLHAYGRALPPLRALLHQFPQAAPVRQLSAALLFHLRKFDACKAALQALQADFPHRVAGMDLLSNVLYVLDDAPALAALAEWVWRADPTCFEAAVVMGNFHSCSGQHDSAVAAFQRGLRMHPGHATLWVLLGHEFIELKDMDTAVYCYRGAVQADVRDYRYVKLR